MFVDYGVRRIGRSAEPPGPRGVGHDDAGRAGLAGPQARISAGTAGAYLAHATNIAAGSFKITVANVPAGSLGEAIVLSFVALKRASS